MGREMRTTRYDIRKFECKNKMKLLDRESERERDRERRRKKRKRIRIKIANRVKSAIGDGVRTRFKIKSGDFDVKDAPRTGRPVTHKGDAILGKVDQGLSTEPSANTMAQALANRQLTRRRHLVAFRIRPVDFPGAVVFNRPQSRGAISRRQIALCRSSTDYTASAAARRRPSDRPRQYTRPILLSAL
ncbi:hypothetical protein EVAR_35349_1 [Eumeta japonica]|uniref:Uncharacterized protein n=1 Tax=Eumeta variegata TaxID=151549 RepID=A0A4C1XME5_EUMVA|nr:hypothetical protein EVAR_35349_1 [Eumeta japonica]